MVNRRTRGKSAQPHHSTVGWAVILMKLACILAWSGSSAFAQEKAPLVRVAEALDRGVGSRDVDLGRMCDLFGLAPPSGKCVANQMTAEEGNQIPSFNTFVEPGKSIRRIILASHDSKSGYAFLTGTDGKLLDVVRGSHVSNGWNWSKAPITPQTRSAHSDEVKYWIDHMKEIEALPVPKR